MQHDPGTQHEHQKQHQHPSSRGRHCTGVAPGCTTMPYPWPWACRGCALSVVQGAAAQESPALWFRAPRALPLRSPCAPASRSSSGLPPAGKVGMQVSTPQPPPPHPLLSLTPGPVTSPVPCLRCACAKPAAFCACPAGCAFPSSLCSACVLPAVHLGGRCARTRAGKWWWMRPRGTWGARPAPRAARDSPLPVFATKGSPRLLHWLALEKG